ncbi:MAG: DUF4091 domain-containing protein [Planctomycetes bacterium]|nr:DUF4091 domain-containing protein [Planctomycetota bacterium]
MIRILIALSVLIITGSSIHAAQPVVWAVDSLTRVGRGDAPGSNRDTSISAARGEVESFQVVVRAPSGGLTRVRFTLSALTGPAGATIPAAKYTRYREHYVTVSPASADWGGSNRSLGAGSYPDALIPFDDDAGVDLAGALDAVPFALSAGQNQPLWIDLAVPRDAVPGQYTGTWTVSSDQGQVSGNVSVRVRPFTLPLKPSLRSAFMFWNAAAGRADRVELLRHKLMPTAAVPAEERGLIDAEGLSCANLGFWSGADMSGSPMSPAPSVAAIAAEKARHQSDLALYNFTADEIGGHPEHYPVLKQWARNLHQAGIDNLVSMAPVAELLDDGSGTGRSAVDIWVVLPMMCDASRSLIAQAQAKGDDIWSYNCLAQDGYSPKWLIDYAPMNFRIQPGFANQTAGITGLLYWKVDGWNAADPWNQVNNVGVYSSANFPGEGQLFYPGQQVGLAHMVPSMRAKWLRDGVEDYEYVQLLSQMGKRASALATIRPVAPDWTNWTRSPAALATARDQLATAIEGALNRAPLCLGVSPASGSGQTARLVCTFSDPDGTVDLAGVTVLVNSTVDGRNACWIYVDRAARTISLASDDTTTWSPAKTLGTAGVLENSQCRIDVGASSSCDCTTAATVELALTFKPAFVGIKNVYLRAVDRAGAIADYAAKATWTVTTSASVVVDPPAAVADGDPASTTAAGDERGASGGGCGLGGGVALLLAAFLAALATLARPAPHRRREG